MRTPRGLSQPKGNCRKEAKKQRSKGFGAFFMLGSFASWLLCDLILGASAPALRAEPPLRFPTLPPTPPAEAAKTFEVLHGFQMQLIAAEPLVCDPVALTYDEDGRAFVCEMSDYPYTDKAHHKASQENPTDQAIGKVRLLVDTDGDGVFDKATVFADGLSWPTGSVCWKGGIIVVATPDIWYFKDTDGDGVADVRQKLFTGLKKLNVQAVANNPIWGLDNKIYIAGGSNGGTLQNLVHPEVKPITFRRNDLILDPVRMTIELASGGARFGNTRDDWGNRFLCNIRNPLEHVVIEQRYLARNPYLPPVNPLADVAESGDQLPVYRISPPEQWRELRAKRWTGDSTVAAHMPRSELVGAGVVTSSSGCTIYRGDAYPPEFRGMAFVNDVAGNLFYRLKLEPDGVTFKGARIDGKKEFVASKDIWFRPVNFANAPDGTLTVCDMYREVIEHPWSLPDDIHAALDLERGRDMGRLYRLAPPSSAGVPPASSSSGILPEARKFIPRPAPHLGKASTAELVALLIHPNAWHRDTAHRLLFERQDKSAVPLLRKALEIDGNPIARIEAMWLLDSFGELNSQQLLAASKDRDPRLRETFALMAESRRELRYQLLNLVRDEDKRVRFQAILSMSSPLRDEHPDNHEMASILPKVAQVEGGDSWIRAAFFSHEPHWIEALTVMTAMLPPDEVNKDFLKSEVQIIARSNNLEACEWVLAPLRRHIEADPALAAELLPPLVGALTKQSKSISALKLDPNLRAWLESLVESASGDALRIQDAIEDRIRAIALLALLEFPKLQPIAAKLLLPGEPDAVRLATIKLLGQQRDAKVADLLLEAWPTFTPAPREAALQALSSKPALTGALLSAVEAGRIKPAEISPTARTLLTRISDPKLRERATKLFAASGTRAEVIAKYQSALNLKGDTEAGHKVFQTICAACHRKGDEGRDIGPNLATVLSWTPEQLLTNILDPNREVAPNFLLYIVETNDRRILSGIITNETPATVSLKGADGVEQSLPRSEVKSLKSAGVSLMPEGVEAAITPQQMADVMAFIRGS
jgi:putative membrane-bound dehydrogenase-like protein